VEKSEEADDGFVGAGFFAEFEANGLYSLPVVGAVDGVGAQGEDRLGVPLDAVEVGVCQRGEAGLHHSICEIRIRKPRCQYLMEPADGVRPDTVFDK